jgi:hypothetical protein
VNVIPDRRASADAAHAREKARIEKNGTRRQRRMRNRLALEEEKGARDTDCDYQFRGGRKAGRSIVVSEAIEKRSIWEEFGGNEEGRGCGETEKLEEEKVGGIKQRSNFVFE